MKGGGFPPVVNSWTRNLYINALEPADEGNLQTFVDFLALQSSLSIADAIAIGDNIIQGVNRYLHSNRGGTIDNQYYPPGTIEADCLDMPLEAGESDKTKKARDDDHDIDL